MPSDPRELLQRATDMIGRELEKLAAAQTGDAPLDHDTAMDLARYASTLHTLVNRADADLAIKKRKLATLTTQELELIQRALKGAP